MNIKKRQEELIKHIEDILNAYENNQIGIFDGETETEEDVVKRLIQQHIEIYLTTR